VARHIARVRCGAAPQYFDAWLARHGGGEPHPTDLLECLVALVASESIGMPPNGASDEHIEGFVAEHIWQLLTLEDALTFGFQVRVDSPIGRSRTRAGTAWPSTGGTGPSFSAIWERFRGNLQPAPGPLVRMIESNPTRAPAAENAMRHYPGRAGARANSGVPP